MAAITMAKVSNATIKGQQTIKFYVDDSESQDGAGLLKGLLSCIAGVGGVSFGLWLLVFIFLEPYDPGM
jgi:hypothetical protein